MQWCPCFGQAWHSLERGSDTPRSLVWHLPGGSRLPGQPTVLVPNAIPHRRTPRCHPPPPKFVGVLRPASASIQCLDRRPRWSQRALHKGVGWGWRRGEADHAARVWQQHTITGQWSMKNEHACITISGLCDCKRVKSADSWCLASSGLICFCAHHLVGTGTSPSWDVECLVLCLNVGL